MQRGPSIPPKRGKRSLEKYPNDLLSLSFHTHGARRMFEPTFTVTFHIPSPPPPGIELEPDSIVSSSHLRLATVAHLSASKSMPGVFAPEAVCLSTEYRRRASVENPAVTMQKTPESDLQADVQKVALGSTPLFQKFCKAIRSREEVTSWYHSQSSVPMDEPPLSCHLYSEALVVKAWIWRGKAWAPIKEGDPHPHISGYCVSFLRDAEPSWVTKRTMQGLVHFLNPATKADVEAGKDGDDKEEITLPSFFPNFVAWEEMYLEARDAFSRSSALMGPACAHQEHVVSFVVEYLELGDNRTEMGSAAQYADIQSRERC
ncbi:hypothetical protein BKA83DRAFT_4123648 [Pisolithus microcarpus]|nr:hypothetical protein BKA83DRAFT_4123648 [Pisolithus microcarpus]